MTQRLTQFDAGATYSPEYSSPLSSTHNTNGNMRGRMQARFNKVSSSPNCNKAGGNNFGSAVKMLTNSDLPVFKESNTANGSKENEQMLTSLNFDDGMSGLRAALLSDMSDEMLIKQLQLNQNMRKNKVVESGQEKSSLVLQQQQSLSNMIQESSINMQPFKELQTNSTGHQISPIRRMKQSQQQSKKPAQSMHKKQKSTTGFTSATTSSQQKNFFGDKASALKHGSPSPARASQTHKRTQSSQSQVISQKQTSSRRRITPSKQSIQQHANDENAPSPHPYPVQQYLKSDITDTYDCSPTMTTNHKETSPAILSHDNRAYILTDSDHQLLNSASPVACVKAVEQTPAQYYCNINGFAENSTIHEQVTEEQASATMINYTRQVVKGCSKVQQSSLSNLVNSKRNETNQQDVVEVAGVAPEILICADSESLDQIRMINDAINKNMPSNYSPERSHDASSSLRDMSIGNAAAEPVSNGQLHNNNANALLDFEHSYKNLTNPAASTSNIINNQSGVAQKDSGSGSAMYSHQQVMKHYIQAIMQKQDDNTCQQNLHQRQQPMLNSTLLNLNEDSDSKVMQHPQKQSQQQKGRPESRRQSNNGRSPNRQPTSSRAKYYGRQAPKSDQFYKPVLKAAEKMASTSSSVNVQEKLDFNTRNIAQPKPQLFSDVNRSKSRGSQGRTAYKASLSPSAITTPKLNSMGTMILKQGLQKKSLQRSTNQQKSMLRSSQKSSPISVAQNSRNHQNNITVSKSMKNQDLLSNDTPNHYNNVRSKMSVLAQSASSNPFATSQRMRPNKPNQTTASSCQKRSTTPKARSPMTRIIKMTAEAGSTTQRRTIQQEKSNTAKQGKMFIPEQLSPIFNEIPIQKPSEKSLSDMESILSVPTPMVQPYTTAFYQKQVELTQEKPSQYQLRRVIEALKHLDIQTFLELERIKKPQAAILAISRMSCIFFEAMRGRDAIIMDQVEQMQSWQQIQEYMRMQLTCCVPELRVILKQKIVSLGCFNGEESPTLDTAFLAIIQKLYDSFFIESKIRVIKRFIQTSKQLRGLVHLIYAFICLALNLEREFNKKTNLLGLTEQSMIKFDEAILIKQSQPLPTPAARVEERSKSPEKSMEEHSRVSHVTTNTQDDNQNVSSSCSCQIIVTKQPKNNLFRTISVTPTATSSTGGRVSSDNNNRQSNRGKKSTSPLSKSPSSSQQPKRVTMGGNKLQQNTNNLKQKSIGRQNRAAPQRKLTQSCSTQQLLAPQQQPVFFQNTMPYEIDIADEPINFPQTIHQQIMGSNYATNQTPEINSHQLLPQQQQNLQMEKSGTSQSMTNGRSSGRTSKRHPVVGYLQTKQVIERSRQRSFSNGSDFASVVRASITSITPANRTPNRTLKAFATLDKQEVRIQKKAALDQTAPKKYRSRSKKTNNVLTSNNCQQSSVAPQNIRVNKRDVSPNTPSRSSGKFKTNTTTPSQQQSARVLQSKQPRTTTPSSVSKMTQLPRHRHQRTSTLYKNTASHTAKLQVASVQQQKSPIHKRESSVSTGGLTQRQKTTKSQINLKQHQVGVKRSTTPKGRSSKVPAAKRGTQQHQTLVSEQMVDDFMKNLSSVMTFNQSKNSTYDNEVVDQNRGIPPSFGNEATYNQRFATYNQAVGNDEYICNDEQYMRQISEQQDSQEEDSSANLIFLKKVLHNTCKNPYDQRQPLQYREMAANEPAPTSYVTSTTPLVMQNDFFTHQKPQQQQLANFQQSPSDENESDEQIVQAHLGQFSNSSLSEPSCAIVFNARDNEKDYFIQQKAQDITDNINSIFTQENDGGPQKQIDMATIQKLKMQRIQPEIQQTRFQNSTIEQRLTLQSCNIVTTETHETEQHTDEDNMQFQSAHKAQNQNNQDNTFNDALNKLKAEVESLMQHRTRQ